MDFYFPPPTPSSVPTILSPPMVLTHSIPPTANYEIKVFDGDGGSFMRSVAFFDLFSPIPASFGGTFAHAKEVLDTTEVL